MGEEFLCEALTEEEDTNDRPNQEVQRVVSQVPFERTLHQKGSLPQNQLFTLKIRIAHAEFTPRSNPHLALYGFKVGICERRALDVGLALVDDRQTGSNLAPSGLPVMRASIVPTSHPPHL